MGKAAKIIRLDEDEIDDSVGSVYVTKEYDKFVFKEENRHVNRAHVHKLVASIKKNNLLYGQPILVNEKFEIIDGQHRFEAAKKLELPIYYIKHDGLTIDDAITLNINTKNWGYRDYLDHWITKGKEEYKYFDKFLDTYGFGYSVSLALLGLERASDGQRLTDLFNEGRFKAKYKDFAEDLGEKCKQMGEHGSFTTNRTFVLALDQAREMDGWNYEIFMKKLQMCPDRFTKCSNQENYLRMMEDVINYHNHGERIRLY